MPSLANAAFVRQAFDRLEARAPHDVARALRRVRTELDVQARHRRGIEKAAALAAPGLLRLNLGSGSHPKPGWVNVDLADDRADIQLDLREPLPFPDASVEAVYAADAIDSLSYANLGDSTSWALDTPGAPSDALALLRECRRVLRPGGRLDIVVPDAECMLDAYAARGDRPFAAGDRQAPPWCNTPMHQVNYLFRHGSQRQYAYDFETLERVLARTGFSDIARRACDPDLDVPTAEGSLFVRAFRRRT
jgi:predicted SAM-dependent methyltransferase